MSGRLLFRRPRQAFEEPILGIAGAARRSLPPPVAAAAIGCSPGTALLALALGLLRKRLIRLAAVAPVGFRAPADMARSQHSRRLAAAERGVALFSWEHPFVDAAVATDGSDFAAADLGAIAIQLQDAAKPRRVALAEATQRWVDNRVEQAWRDIDRPAGLDDRMRAIDINLEWLVLDAGFVDRLGDDGYAPSWLKALRAHGGASARLESPFARWAADFAETLDAAVPSPPPAGRPPSTAPAAK